MRIVALGLVLALIAVPALAGGPASPEASVFAPPSHPDQKDPRGPSLSEWWTESRDKAMWNRLSREGDPVALDPGERAKPPLRATEVRRQRDRSPAEQRVRRLERMKQHPDKPLQGGREDERNESEEGTGASF